MPIYNASIAYAKRGHAAVHVTRILGDLGEEEFNQPLFISIRKKLGSDQEERVQNWPGPEEDFDFVKIPEADIELNQRDAGLDLHLLPELNNPIALDYGTGQYVLRLRFGPEGKIYECHMTMQAGAEGELYLIAAEDKKDSAPEVKSTLKPAQAKTVTQAKGHELTADERRKLMLYGAGALALLVLLFGLYSLFKSSDSETVPTPPAKVQTAAPQAQLQQQPKPQAENSKPQAEEQKNPAPEIAAEQKPAAEPEKVSPQPAAKVEETAAVQAAPAAPCSLTGQQGSDQELLAACLKSGPDKQQLYTLAEEALKQGRCDLLKRLLTSSGRAGHGASALLMARLYDPLNKESSSCVSKSAEQAVYWYQKAAAAGEKNAAAALENLKNAH
ncbi:MAG: hypothetical protein K6F05_07705 [Succinivibrio sp.]|nr:hypothetical protein [Succinivibrio sp.]